MQDAITWFAPAARASHEAIVAAAERARQDEIVTAMLEAMPSWAMLVNRERQIIAANHSLQEALGASSLASLLGQRPGEALGCEVAARAPSGCGTGHECAWCGAAAMEQVWRTRKPALQECLVLLCDERGHALDLEVLVSPALIERLGLLIVAMRDVGAEKRRRVLERVFFHDVMNTASGIQGIANVLAAANPPELDAEFKQLLVRATGDLVEEIAAQRQLMAAESGEVVPSPMPVTVSELLRQLADVYDTDRAEGRRVCLGNCPDVEVETDLVLLRRVLSNMVKNAVEACRPGETVTIWAEALDAEVLLAVHNPGVMPQRVATQVFHRSFSTKGLGRGIGTYSIKLFGERYLGGKVAFSSTERAGTTFTLRIPVVWRAGEPS